MRDTFIISQRIQSVVMCKYSSAVPVPPHNGAFVLMSRMRTKPWGDIKVCYPTRVGHPGTDLEGRFFDNNCQLR